MTTDREPTSGVSLQQGPLGGTMVIRGGQTLGWIYAHGDHWNAYTRVGGIGCLADALGTFTRDDAIQAIIAAAPPLPS
jgi:hypothetical protein